MKAANNKFADKAVAFPDLIESLRTMIVSHRENDDESFRHGAEAIIKALTVQNRPSEARALKDALKRASSNQTQTSSSNRIADYSISVLTRLTPGLITFVNGKPKQLVFQEQTGKSLESVIKEHRSLNKLAEAGLSPRRKLLFWGPPGCGKTATAQWLSQELGLPCGIVRLASLITSYVGETGSNIQKVLQIADQTPMILLIDEADAIAKSRDDSNDVGELRRVVNTLLQSLDAFTSNHSIIVLASNHTELFDSALWRRFDDVVEFPLPSESERLQLLKHLTSGIKITGNLSLVARGMAGRSFAEVERAVFEVAKEVVIEDKNGATSAEILRASRQFEQKVTDAKSKKIVRRTKK